MSGTPQTRFPKQLRGSQLALILLAVALVASWVVYKFPSFPVERLALVVAVVTFAAVLIQIFIAQRELDAVNEDLALTNRRASLYATTTVPMEIPHPHSTGTAFQLDLRVHNKGKRMNSEARISLMLLEGWSLPGFQHERVDITPDVFDDTYLRAGLHVISLALRGPFFPQDKVDFINLKFVNPIPTLPIPDPLFYRIIYEDGAFPDFDTDYDVLRAAVPRRNAAQ